MMLEHARMDNVTNFLLCIQQYGIGDPEPQTDNPQTRQS